MSERSCGYPNSTNAERMKMAQAMAAWCAKSVVLMQSPSKATPFHLGLSWYGIGQTHNRALLMLQNVMENGFYWMLKELEEKGEFQAREEKATRPLPICPRCKSGMSGTALEADMMIYRGAIIMRCHCGVTAMETHQMTSMHDWKSNEEIAERVQKYLETNDYMIFQKCSKVFECGCLRGDDSKNVIFAALESSQ